MEPTLCAIVRDDGSGLLQARLLELDIAVASDSIDGIIEEIRHALIVEHMLAGEQGRTPFVPILTSPRHSDPDFRSAPKSENRKVDLPAEVEHDLAIALRRRKLGPVVITTLSKAA